jgi:hypothetical protein
LDSGVGGFVVVGGGISEDAEDGGGGPGTLGAGIDGGDIRDDEFICDEDAEGVEAIR